MSGRIRYFHESVLLLVNNGNTMVLIPPLSLQVILENIIYTNALTKKQPLQIRIDYDKDNHLLITHSLHESVLKQLNKK